MAKLGSKPGGIIALTVDPGSSSITLARASSGGAIERTSGSLRGQLAQATCAGGIERAGVVRGAIAVQGSIMQGRVESAESMAMGALDVHILVDASGSALAIRNALISVAENLGNDLAGDNPLLKISYGAHGGGGNVNVGQSNKVLAQANVATDGWESSLNEALAKVAGVCDEDRLSVVISFNDALPSADRGGVNLADTIKAFNDGDTVHIVCYVPSPGSDERDKVALKDLCNADLGNFKNGYFFDFSGVDPNDKEVMSRFIVDIIGVVKGSNPRVPSTKGVEIDGIKIAAKRSVLMETVQAKLIEGRRDLLKLT